MAKRKEDKTNVMRLLEQKKIPYTPHEFTPTEEGKRPGLTMAQIVGVAEGLVYKTLVTEGASGANYVFVVPVEGSLDLKKAAKAVGEKSVAMLLSRNLLPLTGYIHGGCSPVGMKKLFPTVIDASARELDTMLVSAGRVGHQVELTPSALAGLVNARFADVQKSE